MEFQQEQYHPVTQDTQHQQCRSKWWALKNLSPKGQKDGPYAYFVCLCGFICILLPTGCAFSYGILFPVLLAEFKEGKAKTGTLFIRYKPRNLSTRRTVGMYCVPHHMNTLVEKPRKKGHFLYSRRPTSVFEFLALIIFSSDKAELEIVTFRFYPIHLLTERQQIMTFNSNFRTISTFNPRD